MKDLAKICGDRIRVQRREKKWTQKMLGQIAGINANSIAHFESFIRQPGPATLQKLSIALDCSTDYLLGMTDFVK